MSYTDKLTIASLASIENTINDDIAVRNVPLHTEELGGDYWTLRGNSIKPSRGNNSGVLDGIGYHRATVDASGRILDFYSYNYDVNVWQTKTSDVNYRNGSYTFALNYFYCCMGNNGTTRIDTISQYNPVTNTWLDSSGGVAGNCAGKNGFLVNGYFYFVNVQLNSGQTENYYRFDEETKVLTLKGTTGFGYTNQPDGFSIDEIGYSAGGYNPTPHRTTAFRYLDAIDSWQSIKPWLVGKYDSTCEQLGSNGYSVGGQGSGLTKHKHLMEYNPDIDDWKFKTDCPVSRRSSSGLTLNGNMLCVNGGQGNSNTATDTVYEYTNTKSRLFIQNIKTTNKKPNKVFVSTSLNENSINLPIEIRTNDNEKNDSWYSNWTKQGVVVDYGTSGQFDDAQTADGYVLKEGENDYKMWYRGWDGTTYSGKNNQSIGYATSTDGVNWTKQGVVLSRGTGGDIDSVYVSNPVVIKKDNTYTMLYHASNGSSDTVGYATSSDGISWNKQGLALPLGSGGSYDDKGMLALCMVHTDKYYFYYRALSFSSSNQIGVATSTDLVNWTKETTCTGLDSSIFNFANVVYFRGLYYIFYTAAGTTKNIKVASSEDGINYTHISEALYLEGSNELSATSVIVSEHEVKLYYDDYTPISKINLATTTNPNTFFAALSNTSIGTDYITKNAQGLYSYDLKVGVPKFHTQGYWTVLPTSSVNRGEHGGFNLNNLAYVTLGITSSAVELNSTEEYNPYTKTYTFKENNPLTRFTIFSFSLNGLGYAVGGRIVSSSNSQQQADQYNPVSNTWITKANTGYVINNGADFVLNGYGYIANGENSTSGYRNDCRRYNDATDTWETKQNVGVSKRQSPGFVKNGLGYSVTGYSGSDRNDVRAYNDVTDTWSAKSNFPISQRNAKGVTFGPRAFIDGGSYADPWREYMDDYWLVRNSKSTTLSNIKLLSVNNKVISAMGDRDNPAMEQFHPPVDTNNLKVTLYTE